MFLFFKKEEKEQNICNYAFVGSFVLSNGPGHTHEDIDQVH